MTDPTKADSRDVAGPNPEAQAPSKRKFIKRSRVFRVKSAEIEQYNQQKAEKTRRASVGSTPVGQTEPPDNGETSRHTQEATASLKINEGEVEINEGGVESRKLDYQRTRRISRQKVFITRSQKQAHIDELPSNDAGLAQTQDDLKPDRTSQEAPQRNRRLSRQKVFCFKPNDDDADCSTLPQPGAQACGTNSLVRGHMISDECWRLG